MNFKGNAITIPLSGLVAYPLTLSCSLSYGNLCEVNASRYVHPIAVRRGNSAAPEPARVRQLATCRCCLTGSQFLQATLVWPGVHSAHLQRLRQLLHSPPQLLSIHGGKPQQQPMLRRSPIRTLAQRNRFHIALTRCPRRPLGGDSPSQPTHRSQTRFHRGELQQPCQPLPRRVDQHR